MVFQLKPLRIETIATGNELLDGSIIDSNSQRLANAIRPFGFKVTRTTIVPDTEEEISQALSDAAMRADVVIVSGGLGPTSDDLTLLVAAKTFGVMLIKDKKAEEIVLRRLKAFNRKANPGHTKQMFIPEGASALTNHEGSAPGVEWEIGDRRFFFLAGVPREFEFVLENHLVPFFKKTAEKLSQKDGEHRFILKTFFQPESALNEMIQKLKVPAGVTMGYRTHLPENHLKFFVEASSRAAAKKKISGLVKSIYKKIGSDIFSDDSNSESLEFEESIFQSLLKQKTLVSIAESCTGGLASSMLTRVAGSSKVLDRGFVTYSNQAKMDLLGVKSAALQKHGAVSKQVALEMAEGALKNSLAKKAVAITGIAGPSGGTSEKPVGTVWIALASAKKTEAKLFHFNWNRREMIQKFSAYYALKMLKDF
ncbi:MAG: CinA family nicotinamide mononucleotide deamidase-related protein [Deltaproteobacteria bacterium]|nr:CinA family nicotinamide mononucleotide deamidase-related protein [Deltaproteobacteria bacterium]